MYAYPMTADNGYFLYYNKKFLNESDVSSLERILEVCEEKNKEFSMEFNSGWYMYSFFGNTGLELGLNDDGVTNYCTWNSTDNSIKGADALPFVFFRDFGVCQDNESLGFDVFDDGDVVAQVEFVALFVGIVDQRVFSFFHNLVL